MWRLLSLDASEAGGRIVEYDKDRRKNRTGRMGNYNRPYVCCLGYGTEQTMESVAMLSMTHFVAMELLQVMKRLLSNKRCRPTEKWNTHQMSTALRLFSMLFLCCVNVRTVALIFVTFYIAGPHSSAPPVYTIYKSQRSRIENPEATVERTCQNCRALRVFPCKIQEI